MGPNIDDTKIFYGAKRRLAKCAVDNTKSGDKMAFKSEKIQKIEKKYFDESEKNR